MVAFRDHLYQYVSMSPDLATFLLTNAVCLLAFTCACDAYDSGKLATEALELAQAQKDRLDRMQKSAHVGMKETQVVDYVKGFNPKSSWDDNFSRTQLIPRVSWFRRLWWKVLRLLR